MYFQQLEELAPRDIIPGASVRFVHTDHLTVAHWSFGEDTPLPEHAHPHEQVTNIIEGEFELTIAGKTRRLGPGGIALIPPRAIHSGRAVTKCYVVDVFYPVREDYT